MAKACVFLADGFEEVEGLTVIDLLRRAGVELTMVSVTGKKEVTGRTDITVLADTVFEEMAFEGMDLLVLPGGMPGTKNLEMYKPLEELLRKAYKEGTQIGAICAAPMVFGHFGFLEGKKATIYPGMDEHLYGAEAVHEEVVHDGNVTTSRGIGTAIPFALSLIETLCGAEKAEEIRTDIVFKCC